MCCRRRGASLGALVAGDEGPYSATRGRGHVPGEEAEEQPRPWR